MKEKCDTLLKRLKLAWLIIWSNEHRVLFEKCERCGSTNVEIGASTITIGDDNIISYHAKYFCRKCGASCFCSEKWESNNLIKFNKESSNE